MASDSFELAGRSWPKVKWWQMKGMCTLYITLWAAMLTSATNGEPYWLSPLASARPPSGASC